MLIDEVLPAMRDGRKAKYTDWRGKECVIFVDGDRVWFNNGTRSPNGAMVNFNFTLSGSDFMNDSFELI